MKMQLMLPVIGISTIERVRQRSSSVKQADLQTKRFAKQFGVGLWYQGMNLLQRIWAEESATLAAIWAAPDADEFAQKIQMVTPAADAKLIEETISAFTPDEKLAKKVSKVVADNRQAKQELAELASKK